MKMIVVLMVIVLMMMMMMIKKNRNEGATKVSSYTILIPVRFNVVVDEMPVN